MSRGRAVGERQGRRTVMTARWGVRALTLGLLVLGACTGAPAAGPSAPAKPAPAATGGAAASAGSAPSAPAAQPAAAPTAPPERSRVIAGYIQTAGGAPFYIGLERGYFEA